VHKLWLHVKTNFNYFKNKIGFLVSFFSYGYGVHKLWLLVNFFLIILKNQILIFGFIFSSD
jgi:hypothetical protein